MLNLIRNCCFGSGLLHLVQYKRRHSNTCPANHADLTRYAPTAVTPEPESTSLIVAGLGGLVLLGRRRFNDASGTTK